MKDYFVIKQHASVRMSTWTNTGTFQDSTHVWIIINFP